MIEDIFDELLKNITPKESWAVKKCLMRIYEETGIVKRTKTRKVSVFALTGKRSKKRNYRNRFPKETISVEDHGGGMFSIGT